MRSSQHEVWRSAPASRAIASCQEQESGHNWHTTIVLLAWDHRTKDRSNQTIRQRQPGAACMPRRWMRLHWTWSLCSAMIATTHRNPLIPRSRSHLDRSGAAPLRPQGPIVSTRAGRMHLRPHGLRSRPMGSRRRGHARIACCQSNSGRTTQRRFHRA